MVSLLTPVPFNGTETCRWKWKCQFLQYKIGLGLANKSRAEQVSIFLADDIMATININEDTVDPDELVKAFNLYFGQMKKTLLYVPSSTKGHKNQESLSTLSYKIYLNWQKNVNTAP